MLRDLAPYSGAFLFEVSEMTKLRNLSLLVMLCIAGALTSAAHAITPPTVTPVKCDQLLFLWGAVTTRAGGAPLAAGELAKYALYLTNESAPIYIPAANTSFIYSIPAGYTTTANDVAALTAIDSGGLESAPSVAVVLPVGSKCPKSPPAAPAALRATAKTAQDTQ